MRNYLLTIAIDKYKYQSHLPNCVKDVRDFSEILIDRFPFRSNEHTELVDEKATSKNIQDTLIKFSQKVEARDNLIIFFSGHGYFEPTTEIGYWIPFEGDRDYTSWVSNDTIKSLISRINCKHLFLIVDSCFSHSLLLTDVAKSDVEYGNKSSRWVLTSAFDESYTPHDPKKNSEFAQSIIEFLEEARNDFRVSTLIEYVKNDFSDNEMQSPQGYPLKIKGHKGGELLFTVEQEIDSRDIEGYSDFIKVLHQYRSNVKFDEVGKHVDKTKKIGYQIIREYDHFMKQTFYHVYLYSGIIQSRTYNHIKESSPEVLDPMKLMVYLPRESRQSDPKRRIGNIKKVFKPRNIYYIDEFIRESSSAKLQELKSSDNFLQISNFIVPSFNDTNSVESANKFIEDWYGEPKNPILIVKGTGGIGKTTFAHYVIDRLMNDSEQVIPLFIDSLLVRDRLMTIQRKISQLNLFHFYDALSNNEISRDNRLSEDTFNLNLDAGNFLVVIDGLDEIISKVSGFDVGTFLRSIDIITRGIGGGKVIITCRTHFWNTSTNDRKFNVLELHPFDRTQAKEFFNKSFTSTKKNRRALEFADDFRLTEDESDPALYHPYVLDIIRSIVELDQSDIDLSMTAFGSKILNPKDRNDYIVYRVCERETRRIGQVTVDSQVNFFKLLANQKRGVLKMKLLGKELRNTCDGKIDEVNIEAFKSHPFLTKNQSNVTFKYDFFAEIFRAIEVAEYFNFEKNREDLPINIIETLAENCWYDSGLNIEVAKRVRSWDEDDLLFVSDFLSRLQSSDSLNKETRIYAMGNVLNIALRVNHKFLQNDIESNSILLKSLYESGKGKIRGLVIINLSSEKRIRFDFSDLTLEEAIVDNYPDLYDCHFNSGTCFNRSKFINTDTSSTNTSLSKEHFIDCSYDEQLENALDSFEDNQKSEIDKATSFLNSYFHLFFSNGKLGRQWEDDVIKPRFNGIDKYGYGYKKVTRVLKREGLVDKNEETFRVKLFIPDHSKGDVIRFVKDGILSKSIAQVIRQLS